MLVRKGLLTGDQLDLIRNGTKSHAVVTGMRATGTSREDHREVVLDVMVRKPGGGQFRHVRGLRRPRPGVQGSRRGHRRRTTRGEDPMSDALPVARRGAGRSIEGRDKPRTPSCPRASAARCSRPSCRMTVVLRPTSTSGRAGGPCPRIASGRAGRVVELRSDMLIPDPDARRHFAAGCPRLPLAMFEEVHPPPQWPDAPAAYLQLSEAYGDQAAKRGNLAGP